MENNKTIAVYTLGCRANQFDSESLFEDFKSRGYQRVEEHQDADIHLVNTCTVTNTGDKKSAQLLKKIIREKKSGKVVATGCSAQLDPKGLLELGVDFVVDNANKSKLASHLESGIQPMLTSNIYKVEKVEHTPITHFNQKARAHLKVQDGCNQYCSYCIIPFVRGKSRSLPFEEVKEQFLSLLQQGYKEIVLTGIHVGHYKDPNNNKPFSHLLKSLLEIEGDFRIRLSSIEPREINPEIIRLFSQYPKKLCRHLHIAVQSGSSSILEKMRRGHDAEYLRRLIDSLYAIDNHFGIGLDIIVGFPGETEEEFSETVEFLNSYPFSYGHVFRFSPKEGTAAAKYPDQIPEKIKKERSDILREIVKSKQKNFLEKIAGTEQDIIWETPRYGTSSNYTHVRAKENSQTPGSRNTLKLGFSIQQKSAEKFPSLDVV